MSFAGTLGDTTGKGTELAAIPGLTKDLGAETCSSGTLTWRAKAPPAGSPAGEDPAYRLTLTRGAAGHVSESITRR